MTYTGYAGNNQKKWFPNIIPMNFVSQFAFYTIPEYYFIMPQSSVEFSKKVMVTNELGIHARSAALIAKIAQKAASKIWLIKDSEKVDASSIIDILTLGCACGSKIILALDDRKDMAIFNEIAELIETGFGE